MSVSLGVGGPDPDRPWSYHRAVPRIDPRDLGRAVLLAAATLVIATLAVAFLESVVGLSDASALFIVVVVVNAFLSGTLGAVIAATGAFVVYDFYFTEPVGSLTIADPAIWLDLALLLFVGIVVGQLVALLRARADEASAREREAQALFRLSRALATRSSTLEALPSVATMLRDDTRATRVWVSFGSDDASERVAADTGGDVPPVAPAIVNVLGRASGDEPAGWMRVHRPAGRARTADGTETYRARMTVADRAYGSVWSTRPRRLGDPDRTETRLLAAAADQLAQALAHDRLAAESQAAEIARQSDALKSALLQSVSHDLRTPLATIRAAAGTLQPGSGLTPDEQRESADAIDREVEYLDRLVTNLLDLSRIEAGALRAERDVYELDDLVGRTLERLSRRIGDRPLDTDLAGPPVDVDPVFLDEAVTNVVENALKYSPSDSRLRITARASGDGFVRLTIEDAGPGVPDATLPRLFEKFYRVPGRSGGSRSGTGVGLAVVRGLIEATGGRVSARHGELGGLAIDLDLPRAVETGVARTPA
jgi:two-component system sensor histidine kinase KdpD